MGPSGPGGPGSSRLPLSPARTHTAWFLLRPGRAAEADTESHSAEWQHLAHSTSKTSLGATADGAGILLSSQEAPQMAGCPQPAEAQGLGTGRHPEDDPNSLPQALCPMPPVITGESLPRPVLPGPPPHRWLCWDFLSPLPRNQYHGPYPKPGAHVIPAPPSLRSPLSLGGRLSLPPPRYRGKGFLWHPFPRTHLAHWQPICPRQ